MSGQRNSVLCTQSANKISKIMLSIRKVDITGEYLVK